MANMEAVDLWTRLATAMPPIPPYPSFSAGTGSSQNTPGYAGETSRGQRNKLDQRADPSRHSSISGQIIFKLDELLIWLTLPKAEGTEVSVEMERTLTLVFSKGALSSANLFPK